MVAHHTLTSRTWTARARQSTATRPARRAFTLVELLVVITIIAILIGLLIVTLGPIIVRSSDFRLQSEIEQLAAACEKFKDEFGFYPPDFHNAFFLVDPTATPLEAITDYNIVRPALLQILNTGWPNHMETELAPSDTRERLEVWWDEIGKYLAQSAHETGLWYWLSQTFNDAQYPLTGRDANSIRKVFFEFDNERLHDFSTVDVAANPVPAGRLWHYEQDGYEETPYIYFHSSSYGFEWSSPEVAGETVAVYLTPSSADFVGDPIDPAVDPPYNQNSFQIIASGSDSSYGTKYSASPTAYKDPRDPADADNITNFSEGRIETMKAAQ